MITKQKRNLIFQLSFYMLMNVKNKDIEESQNIIKACIHYTNKQIKELINDFQLPF